MRICVYGSASDAIDKRYLAEAEELGRRIGEGGHTLVFGAGATGVMGACARGCYSAGGELIGVAPTFFDKPGVLFRHCTEMIFTKTMRERKQILEDRSDVFLVAPGGIGTMDEFFEILTLRTLGQHEKPVILWNCHGCWNDLITMLDSFVKAGLLTEKNRAQVQVMENLW